MGGGGAGKSGIKESEPLPRLEAGFAGGAGKLLINCIDEDEGGGGMAGGEGRFFPEPEERDETGGEREDDAEDAG